jgi:hypothetical protein
VNGQLLIDDWNDHSVTENSATIALAAGQRYDLRMEYYDNLDNARTRLSWSSPSTVKAVIPSTRLFP